MGVTADLGGKYQDLLPPRLSLPHTLLDFSPKMTMQGHRKDPEATELRGDSEALVPPLPPRGISPLNRTTSRGGGCPAKCCLYAMSSGNRDLWGRSTQPHLSAGLQSRHLNQFTASLGVFPSWEHPVLPRGEVMRSIHDALRSSRLLLQQDPAASPRTQGGFAICAATTCDFPALSLILLDIPVAAASVMNIQTGNLKSLCSVLFYPLSLINVCKDAALEQASRNNSRRRGQAGGSSAAALLPHEPCFGFNRNSKTLQPLDCGGFKQVFQILQPFKICQLKQMSSFTRLLVVPPNAPG